ncbi:MAG TPA: PucR family transcriptional regulator ligand-binding domain-containing protein [Solirubrobacteraceae bacterium]|nr:PucR family transcriptional regulator ligand-binding domain-containing protein [Solirubrobacteraceae bacterium]
MRLHELVAESRLELRPLAGHQRLGDEVRWVHVTDLLDPSPYLRGGELILTNGLWRSSPADSDRFIHALADSGVPAVGFAVYRGEKVPADVVRACDRHGLLLLEVPDQPFQDIEEHVIGAITAERTRALEQAMRMEQELTRRAARGDGVNGILGVVAGEWTAPAWTIDPSAKLLGCGDPPPSKADVAAAWLTAARSSAELALGDGRPGTISVILDPDTGCWEGALVLERDPATMGEGDTARLQLVGDHLRLQLRQLRAAERQRRDTVAAVVRDVMAGSERSGATAEELRRLGLDAGTPALAVSVAAGEDVPLDIVADGVAALFRMRGAAVLVTVIDDRVVALAGLGAEPIAERDLAELGDRRLALGIATVSPGHLRRALVEADEARRFAAAQTARPAIARSNALGSHALVLALTEPDVREAFSRSVLAPIESYDRERRTDLVHTLRSYLANCGAWSTTAEALHVHVNTLRYRVARIEQLTGRDLASMDDRVDFHLALRMREM